MSAAKEIRTKIRSVKNTQKITKAMEMVAASKMRRAQARMRAARPYGEKIREVCAHLARANLEYRHPFTRVADDTKPGGLIVVTTDKGLCGGLNTNALRLATQILRDWDESGRGAKVTVFGNKGAAFFNRINSDIVSQATGLGDAPALADLIGAMKTMTDAFAGGEVGAVELVYTRFINTVKQEAVREQLLPLTDEALGEGGGDAREFSWDYLYEPAAGEVVNLLLARYVEAIIYQSLSENIASEQAARMVAMKAASDNAGNLIDELQLAYNKDRQATITKEISEIVGGAAAV